MLETPNTMALLQNTDHIIGSARNEIRRRMVNDGTLVTGVVEPYGLDMKNGEYQENNYCDLDDLATHLNSKGWHNTLQRTPFSTRGIASSTESLGFVRTTLEGECGYMTPEEHREIKLDLQARNSKIEFGPIGPGTGGQLALIWRESAMMAWLPQQKMPEGMHRSDLGIPLNEEESTAQLEYYLRMMGAKKREKSYYPKFVEAVILRANEIVSHPNYNWCMQACAGNGADMHGPNNWHLPAIVMALAGGPLPGRVEQALENKDVPALLLNFGATFRKQQAEEINPDNNILSIQVRTAFALQNLANSPFSSNNIASRIRSEGFHLQNLWDINGAIPDMAHNMLHPASNEENLHRLSALHPRSEGLGISMAKEAAEKVKAFEDKYGIQVSKHLTIIDPEGNVLYGTAGPEIHKTLEILRTPLENKPTTALNNGALKIDEKMVNDDGYYIGPDLSNHEGDVEVVVPCFYPGTNTIRISGNLVLRDGEGGIYMGEEEAGTIFATDANIEVGNHILSKKNQGLGAEKFTLLSAGSITCKNSIDLATGNIKATTGNITADKIDASAVVAHGSVDAKGAIYSGRLAVGNGVTASEIHSDWLQGSGNVKVSNKITLMFGAMLYGNIQTESLVVLNPRKGGEGNSYKAPIACLRLRVEKLEPAGIYQPLQGIDQPTNVSLSPGNKDKRMLI